jgi:prolyl oligopeptidase
MRSSLAALALGLVIVPGTALAAEDPHQWLEEWNSPKVDAWIAEHNAATEKRLTADPRYDVLREEALEIMGAKDRIAMPGLHGAIVTNFWQDGDHLRGIWRKTTLADYARAEPAWQTVLDIDALGQAEGKSFVYKGANCLLPEETRCLVSLSIGGEDATEVREFDLAAGRFVEGGFALPRSIQWIGWEDADTLLVSTNWSGDDLTKSGYPYIVKRLRRGQKLSDAQELFRATKDDLGVGAGVLIDGAGNRLTTVNLARDFYRSETLVDTGGKLVRLAIPEKSNISGMVAGRVLVKLEEDWTVGGATFRAGSLVSLERADVLADPASPKPSLVWAPGPREGLEEVSVTRDRAVLVTIDNVRGRVWSLTPVKGGKWKTRRIAMPDNMAIGVISTRLSDNTLFVNAEGFLDPTTLYQVDAAKGTARVAKSLPARFDGSRGVVEQFEATSKDGTKIPYFVVRPKDAKFDGSTPTLLNAYGGFQVSKTPFYSGTLGKNWIERGGAYVLANIRGGGEFGPAWHEAALRTNRQRAYDDFAAVAQDLIARKLTSPRRLGIFGGSNGGLLMGVEMTQHPELFRAVSIEVPLLDMLRIGQIARGASWQGEYGDPDKEPEIRAFWERVSPYHALRKDGGYPEPYIFTTTRDDRVGPQHARKFAARMEELGLPYYFYENTEGGHGTGADIKHSAHTAALWMVYFIQKLMD